MVTATWNAARKSGEISLQRAAERDPLVAAALERFPGAEVVDIRPPKGIDMELSAYMAAAMERRRRELIAQPLSRIWRELALAAIAAEDEFRRGGREAE